MAKVTWSTESKLTVGMLGAFLAENYGEDYADKVLDSIEKTVHELADHPTKGRPAALLGQRRWQLNNHHYVVYEISDEGIFILSMLSYKLGE
jgi:plasmid stabilization system protein ParE